jgi:hypothetical protein
MSKRTFLFQIPVEIEYENIMELQKILDMVLVTFSETHFQDENTLKYYVTGECEYAGLKGGFE